MKQNQDIVLIMIIISLFRILPAQGQNIESYLTTADRKCLFSYNGNAGEFSDRHNERRNYIIVDPTHQYQSMEGFGFALTGGSAQHIIRMNIEERKRLLSELFDSVEGIGISYIRLTLGASDLNDRVFSYDDMPEGKEDFELKNFSLSQDIHDVIPVMTEILRINPDIKIMASPWSAPEWMKTNGDFHGGKLRKDCYSVYADYFVRYIRAMAEYGININAVTIQNEPLNSGNTPSMPWSPQDQIDFVKNYLGPKFTENGIKTEIVVFDHNCDRPDYALTIYNDPEAARFVSGSAYHHYRGDLSAMSYVHEARPDKKIYFTEQMTIERPGTGYIDIAQACSRLLIDIPRNWSRNVILWNLAANSANKPHTDNGGCSICQGAITIDGNDVIRNIAYYVIAHASKCVAPGSVRIQSTSPWDRSVTLCEDEQNPGIYRANLIQHSNVLKNVAFKTPDNHIVLIVANDSWNKNKVCIQYKGKYTELAVAPGSVTTFVWKE